jgi:hypothetical protein
MSKDPKRFSRANPKLSRRRASSGNSRIVPFTVVEGNPLGLGMNTLTDQPFVHSRDTIHPPATAKPTQRLLPAGCTRTTYPCQNIGNGRIWPLDGRKALSLMLAFRGGVLLAKTKAALTLSSRVRPTLSCRIPRASLQEQITGASSQWRWCFRRCTKGSLLVSGLPDPRASRLGKTICNQTTTIAPTSG